MKKVWRLSTLGVVGFALIFVWVVFVGFASGQEGAYYNKAQNATWIAHEWVGERKSEAAVQDLVQKLNQYQIDTVFVHAGSLESDGHIEGEVYAYASDFLDKARRYDDSIRYLAWIGDVRGTLDDEEANLRENLVREVMIMSEFVDFDGVHFKFDNSDYFEDLLALVKDSRAIVSAGKLLSVAFGAVPSKKEFREFGEYIDQFVVFTKYEADYDDWWYRWLIKERVRKGSNRVGDDELLFVVSDDLGNALKGIVRGLNDFRTSEEKISGVAIYPMWEMNEDKWKTFAASWLK